MSGNEPTLSELIKSSFRFLTSDVHTSMPGKIEAYDNTTQKANVLPLIKKVYKDKEVQSMPVISNVPVMFPRTKNSIISLPIEKGDLVLLIFNERSIDEWLNGSGQESEPSHNRFFDLSDTVAIPGLYPFGLSSDADQDSVLIKHNAGKIKINKDGKLAMGNDSGELLDLIEQILTGIEAITTNTDSGPKPINNIPTFTTIKTTLSNLKGVL